MKLTNSQYTVPPLDAFRGIKLLVMQEFALNPILDMV